MIEIEKGLSGAGFELSYIAGYLPVIILFFLFQMSLLSASILLIYKDKSV